MTAPQQQQQAQGQPPPAERDRTPEAAQAAPAAARRKLILPDEAPARERWLWAAVIVLFALVAYRPALRGQFIWDDDKHVSQNRLLRSTEGLRDIWVTSAMPSADPVTVTPQYYPLTHTLFWIEYRLWGLNPAGYHLTNVLLHSGSVFLLWMLLRELAVPGAFLIAAIFALHPVEVESVAWITERKNTLAGVFYIAALWTYVRFARLSGEADQHREATVPGAKRFPPRAWYALSLGLFLCAMLSKTIACSMPAVAMLLLWWKRKRVTLRDVLSLLPFFAVGLALGLLTATLEHKRVGASGPDWDLSLIQRLLIAGNALWFYLGKLLWPAKLTFSYPKWQIDPSDPAFYVAPVGLILLVAALWTLRRRAGRGPLVAVLIFSGTLVPALGLFNVYPMRYSYVADHFQYLSSITMIALIVVAASVLLKRLLGTSRAQPVGIGMAGVLLLVLGVLTFRQARIYAGPIPLWEDTLAKNPFSWMASYNLGVEYHLKAGKHEREARDLIEQAHRHDVAKQDQEAASLRDEAQQQREAARDLRDKARARFARTLELRPEHDNACYMWGVTLAEEGKHAQAMQWFAKALERNPESYWAHFALGQAYARTKQFDEALGHLQVAARLQPRRWSVRQVLAGVLAEMGRVPEALAEYQEVLKLQPPPATAAQTYLTMGRLLRASGQKAAGFEHLSIAAQLGPGQVRTWLELGRALGEDGYLESDPSKLTRAVQCFAAALDLDPNNTEAQRGLAAVEQLMHRSSATAPAMVPSTVPSPIPTAAP